MKLSTRLLYGNPNKADLKPEKKADGGWKERGFFELLGSNIWNLIKVNLLMIVFGLPIALWVTFNNVVLSNALASNLETDGYMGVFVLVIIALIIAEAPLLGGGMNIIRKYAADEHAFIWSDFKDGVKGNWKQLYGLTAIAVGIALVGVYLGVVFLNYALAGLTAALLGVGACLVLLIMTIMVYVTAVAMLCTYKLKLRHIIKNSLLLTLAKLPMNFLVYGASVLLMVFLFQPNLFIGAEEVNGVVALLLERVSLLPYALPFIFFGVTIPMFIQAVRARVLMKKFMGLEAAETKANEELMRSYTRDSDKEEIDHELLPAEDWITEEEELIEESQKKRGRKRTDASL